MNIKVNFNSKKVTNSFQGSYKRARLWLKNEVAKDTNVYTPQKSGDLQRSVIPSISTNDDYLVWNTVYAKYQYYGCWADGTHVIKNHSETNPQASTFYFEKAKAVNKKKWIRTTKRLAGDR